MLESTTLQNMRIKLYFDYETATWCQFDILLEKGFGSDGREAQLRPQNWYTYNPSGIGAQIGQCDYRCDF